MNDQDKSVAPKPTLNQLADLMAEERRIAELTQRLVDDARAQGYTWQEIGDAAGVSKQSAHTRWTQKGTTYQRNQQRKMRAAARGEFVTDDDAMVHRPTS